jgi:formate dehydrogenase subunit delta
MNSEDLLRMANQIAMFFAPYPHEEAVAAVVEHLRQFWAPVMRNQIQDHVNRGGGGLHELAMEAVKKLA